MYKTRLPGGDESGVSAVTAVEVTFGYRCR